MYRALVSFATNDYDVRRKQILADDFTTQAEIDEFLRIGYIEVYDSSLEIYENGIYNVEDYETADVDVPTGIDTSDATATAGDIATGKTAYAQGQKLTGTLATGNANMDINGISTNTATNSDSYILNRLITKIPNNINISNWTSLAYMFYKCSILENANLENLATTNTINITHLFDSCSLIKNITLFNCNVTNMEYTFYKCSNLEEIILPQNFNSSNVRYYSFCFSGCSKLETIDGIIDMSLSSGTTNMFSSCSKLKNVLIKNLNTGLALNSSTLLTHDSLMYLINNAIDKSGQTGTWEIKLGADNLAKITAEEQAVATAKGWTLTA